MLPGFLECPIEIGFATTEEALISKEYERTLKPFEDRLELLPICRPLIQRAPLRNSWRRLADLSMVVKQWKPDHVGVLYADGLWQLIAAARLAGVKLLEPGPQYEGWMYRGKFAYPDANSIGERMTRWLFGRLLQQGDFTRIHFDDELLLQHVATLPPTRTEVVLPANPVKFGDIPDMTAARRVLGLPEDATIVSCLGMADGRKGVPLAIKAIANLAEQSGEENSIRLYIGGPHDEEVQGLLKQPEFNYLVDAGVIISADKFLSDDEMLLSAAASDLLLAPYVGHSGRSSIVLWAAATGKPVVAVDKGCIRFVVEQQRLGTVCDVQDIQVFADAISNQLAATWTEEDRQRVRTYAKWHSFENYQAMSSALVRQRSTSHHD
jgi:glycosyltransferase involved in cell wall biosynthesis